MSEVSTAGAQQDLRSRVAELERELGEAHQREAATADLLQFINRAEFALQSVFDAIARSAGRLCEAEFVFVLQFDGVLLSSATSYGLTPEGVAAWRKEFPRPAGEDTAIGRAILRRAVVQIPDVLADAAYSTPALVRMLTHRSVVAVPFLREGHPIGGIAVGRAHPGPFPETQIRLLQSFADQAVIAIENTRLFEAEQARTRELSEALEQQIATSKVLEIISSSTGDLQHVLATLLENATRLCQANFGNLFLREESQFFRLVATHNAPPQWAAWWQRTPVVHPHPRSPLGRAVNKEIVHVVDLASEQPYIERDPTFVALVDLAGARAIVSVPMLKDGEVLGVVAIYSQEPRPFTAKQIELLKTFADQAVIAIENP